MQIRNSQTELVITSAGSAMSPRFAHNHRPTYWREVLMLWLLGVAVGIAVMAILVADQLGGRVQPRAQSAISSWDE